MDKAFKLTINLLGARHFEANTNLGLTTLSIVFDATTVLSSAVKDQVLMSRNIFDLNTRLLNKGYECEIEEI